MPIAARALTDSQGPIGGEPVAGSFRDPAGFVFTRDGVIYRQVNAVYREHYDLLMGSGLYDRLQARRLLIPHTEVSGQLRDDVRPYKVLRPEAIQFLSYPYCWCFSQLKDAALATLEIQLEALAHGMSLKDCSAYNIQFRGCQPVLIDTLSFERYEEGRPWVAYRQFCQHFLAPLALMSAVDVRLGQLARPYIDGVPLDLASQLLPFRTRFDFRLLVHVHLHARALRSLGGKPIKNIKRQMSRRALMGLVDHLKSAVTALSWEPESTVWSDYENETNYSTGARDHKEEIVHAWLQEIQPHTVWDLGANVGRFSRIAAAATDAYTVSFDSDHSATEAHYRAGKTAGENRVLPLVLDLANPSPALGWAHQERMAWADRGPVDTVLALALIHHLAIGNGVPLSRVAELFKRVGNHLIVEFIPKSDSQVQRLLASREDVFHDYTQPGFERAFGQQFQILKSAPVRESQRTLYLMRKR